MEFKGKIKKRKIYLKKKVECHANAGTVLRPSPIRISTPKLFLKRNAGSCGNKVSMKQVSFFPSSVCFSFCIT